ncbi:hypothetical protein AB0J21_10250 [Streptomyces sp. NPDC049954]|uniref:hypothetical protein n=1 Tax=Streptomyces sp. NPDC049954 TaxID=3155779 RepID=UPI003442A198
MSGRHVPRHLLRPVCALLVVLFLVTAGVPGAFASGGGAGVPERVSGEPVPGDGGTGEHEPGRADRADSRVLALRTVGRTVVRRGVSRAPVGAVAAPGRGGLRFSAPPPRVPGIISPRCAVLRC